MPALSEYTNVCNTAILILQERGFRCWADDKMEMFRCERDGWDFAAESPVGLLGLVAIFEHMAPAEYREYWWRKEGPAIYGSLPQEAPEFVPVSMRQRPK
ncbi:MAG: hypothetical protein Q8S73_31490 [Deltaproteobacteria bacterium]|nr:hypothetical protein [Myxococcales bacterium]MDP3218670.1 hypothetical protein [Deltaproteobacteria bacterium]